MDGGDRWGDREYSSPNQGGPPLPVRPPAGMSISPYAMDPAYLPQGPEFLFPVETRRKSWNEKMFDRTGGCYMTGLMVGAVWGVGEGVQREVGVSTRLRLTTIVNGVTRRGPFLANNLAVLALLFSPLESALARGRGVEDSLNSVAAATITGALYRSTAGLKSMAVAGGAGCALFGAYAVGCYVLGYSDRLAIFDS